MALTIDQLQIQIEAESTKATSAIDTLIGRLETLQAKLADKDRDILARDFQLSQLSQNSYLVNALTPPRAIPAYMVPNPNCCYDYTVTRNTGCGCGVY